MNDDQSNNEARLSENDKFNNEMWMFMKTMMEQNKHLQQQVLDLQKEVKENFQDNVPNFEIKQPTNSNSKDEVLKNVDYLETQKIQDDNHVDLSNYDKILLTFNTLIHLINGLSQIVM